MSIIDNLISLKILGKKLLSSKILAVGLSGGVKIC